MTRALTVGSARISAVLDEADLDADRIFRLLMGENVEQRRQFIEENATNVKNLDI